MRQENTKDGRCQITRNQHHRRAEPAERGVRHVAVLCAAALVGALLILPVAAVTQAPPASAADVPPCPPGTTSSTPNCIPSPLGPDTVDVPPTPPLEPPVPSTPNGWVSQGFTATRMSIGPDCPWPSTPYSALPCNAPGISVGGRLYDPNGTESLSLGTWIRVDAAGDVPCDRFAASCPYVIRYNPSQIEGSADPDHLGEQRDPGRPQRRRQHLRHVRLLVLRHHQRHRGHHADRGLHRVAGRHPRRPGVRRGLHHAGRRAADAPVGLR